MRPRFYSHYDNYVKDRQYVQMRIQQLQNCNSICVCCHKTQIETTLRPFQQGAFVAPDTTNWLICDPCADFRGYVEQRIGWAEMDRIARARGHHYWNTIANSLRPHAQNILNLMVGKEINKQTDRRREKYHKDLQKHMKATAQNIAQHMAFRQNNTNNNNNSSSSSSSSSSHPPPHHHHQKTKDLETNNITSIKSY